MIAFGLDISTSIIGYCLLTDQNEIIEIGHIDMTKMERDLWIKAEYAKRRIEDICQRHKIDKMFVEDPVARFKRGKSRSHTIVLLAKFNALVSYFAYEASGVKPLHIDAISARNALGLPVQKLELFDFMRDREPFKGKQWPLKRTGKPKDFCYDQMDAYVIGYSGFIIEKRPPKKKKRKRRRKK